MTKEINVEARYCSHCGTQCTSDLVGAEKNLIALGPECGYYPAAHAYDYKTGKRNYCLKYTCPNKKRQWFQLFNPHDDYFVDKVINL